ncbi:hypothetical protein V1460_18380 [Streptomyces sp. SCSIO 30461]|uniref:hypothetical protein n=1 Tax=Streptomyces sp. SCSIO 30461 TaxID=3118085 RepID=UPI0030CB0E87
MAGTTKTSAGQTRAGAASDRARAVLAVGAGTAGVAIVPTGGDGRCHRPGGTAAGPSLPQAVQGPLHRATAQRRQPTAAPVGPRTPLNGGD